MSTDELPDHWIETSLSEICMLNLKVKLDDDLEVGFMPMVDMPTNYFGKTSYEIRKWEKVKKGYTQFKNNDILFAKITPCFENSKAAVISHFPNEWGAGSTEYYVLRPIAQLVDSRLVFALVKTKKFLVNGAANMSGSVGHRRVPKDFVENYTFPLMPLAEQKQIAAKLDELLAQVDTLKTRLDTIPSILKRFRQSVLAAAVSGQLTDEWRHKNAYVDIVDSERYFDKKLGKVESDETYFLIPNTWVWVRFGSQVQLINGDRGKNYPNKSEYKDAGLPFINTGHIKTNGNLSKKKMNYISREKFNSLGSGKIQLNDLVYCLRGATMGKTAIVNPMSEGAIASSLVIVRPKETLLTKFVYIFLISPQGKDLILRFDNGTAQPNLSAKSLSLFPFALPSIEEQTEIVKRLEQLFTFADQIEKRVRYAQSKVNLLTQSILSKAFRGELTEEWREQNYELISGENSAEALLERIKAEREKIIPSKRARKKQE